MTSSTSKNKLGIVAGAIGIALGLTLAASQQGESASEIVVGAVVGFLVALVAGWLFVRLVSHRLRPETRSIRWTRRDLGVVAIGFGLASLVGTGAFVLVRAVGASSGSAVGPAAACFLAALLGGLYLAHRALNA